METQSTSSDNPLAFSQNVPTNLFSGKVVEVDTSMVEYPPLEDDMMWTGTGFIRTKYYGLDDL